MPVGTTLRVPQPEPHPIPNPDPADPGRPTDPEPTAPPDPSPRPEPVRTPSPEPRPSPRAGQARSARQRSPYFTTQPESATSRRARNRWFPGRSAS